MPPRPSPRPPPSVILILLYLIKQENASRKQRSWNSTLQLPPRWLRAQLHGYTGYKRTCSVEQAVSCILSSAWSKTCSTEHRWFARAWFSAHPGCSILREHIASTQGSDWLLSKPTCLSQMAGWGDVPTGSKNNGLNQPKAENHVPCIAHVIKNCVESRDLQAHSYNNVNKGYCKLGQVKGDCSGRERVNSHAPHDTQRTRPWIHGGTGVRKARFQGAASPCSR